MYNFEFTKTKIGFQMKKLAAGIDIGGTNTVLGIVDMDGRVYGESAIRTRDYPEIDGFVDRLHTEIRTLVRNAGEGIDLAGIGIGAPNGNHYNGTIADAPNLLWRGDIPLVAKIKRFFPDIPALITNDANAAAIGEMIYGGAKGMKDFIVVTLGTGLGSGIVANGKLVYGHDSMAGELGHVIVRRDGRSCGCGRKGCLETYVSATGIRRTILELLADRTEVSLFRELNFNDITAQMIAEAAINGDPLATEAFDRTGMMLGEALADAVAITSPEAIFLFGGLAKAGNLIFEPTRKYMEQNMLSTYKNNVKLLPSGLDHGNAAILGASALVWESLSESGFFAK